VPLLAWIALAAGTLWRSVGPGVWLHERRMSASLPLSQVRAIAVRIDPARVQFALDTATRTYGFHGAWSVNRLPDDGILAFNAGQFSAGTPWGWLVIGGHEVQAPGTGRLAMSFVIDSTGSPSLVDRDELPAVRMHARLAFQSYPALLTDQGEIPWELEAPGRGVDLQHRDSRLAVGIAADGAVIVALTRFTGLGAAGERLPFGPNVVEMARFMRSLGCERAMLLDGGISSQLALRRSDGRVDKWANWRAVPLGLVVLPRTDRLSARGTDTARVQSRNP
jgi:exopolysaccharide biosynthesis protein